MATDVSSARFPVYDRQMMHAAINQDVIQELQAKITAEPGLDIAPAFADALRNAKRKHLPASVLARSRKRPPACRIPKDQRFLNSLSTSMEPLEVLDPLSEELKAVLFPAGEAVRTRLQQKQTPSERLALALHRVLRKAKILHNLACVIWQISDRIIAKLGKPDYSALKYLDANLPDFPAPKPHGLVKLPDSQPLSFMSFVPSTTLGSVWGSLTDENKLSIQSELERHITLLRTLRAPPGTQFGGVQGEGVCDSHGWVNHSTIEPITAMKDFVEWQYAIDMPISLQYREFIKTFQLPEPDDWLVFSHGDLHPENIMVDKIADRAETYKVSGIIDWERGGFYPWSWEQSRVLKLFTPDAKTDWYKCIPPCIQPQRDLQRWLAARVWISEVS